MSYTLKVRSGLPFTYHAKKSRFYNLDGSDTTLTDTTVTDPMIAYQGLATSFSESNNLDTISFTGGELPDYTIATGDIKAYAPKGYSYIDNKSFIYGNFDIFGTPTIDTDNGVVSGFSNTDYLMSNKILPSTENWEIVVKFTTGSSFGSYESIIGSSGYGILPFYIRSGGLETYLSSNDSSWNIASALSIMSLTTNTTYKMKVEFTGTAYNWYLWENDDWTLKKTINSSTAVTNNQQLVLGNWLNSNLFKGSIDLSETYVNVNGNLYWSPLGGQGFIVVDDGCMSSSWTDDGSAVNYNVFYNTDDGFYLSTSNYISGSMWTGEINIPSHTVPVYLTQQWTNNGITFNNQFKNTNDFSNRYIEFPIGSLPDNFELLIKATYTTNDSTIRWSFVNSGSNPSTKDPMLAIQSNKIGTYTTTFITRGSKLSTCITYWLRYRKVNGIAYLYHIVDNDYSTDNLPVISSWSNDLISNDVKIYPQDVDDIIRIGNATANLGSYYSKNIFHMDTFQLNEINTHTGKKRQILSSFDGSVHEWVNDDGEQFVLNSNQNSTGDNGCLTDGYGLTGFTDTTATSIISDYTFSYSSGSGSVTPFEIVAHIKTGSSTTGTNRCIYSSGTSYPGGMYLVVLSNGCVEGCIHNNENNFKAITATALQPNTEYWIKVSNYAAGAFFPSPAYSIYLSTDGVNYTLEGTMPGTIPTQWTTTGNRTLVVGSQNGSSSFGNGGVIYPDGSYIKINGSTVWQLGINI